MKKFISIILVLLMLISFSACESFVVRGDSVYIKLYNGTGKNLKIITLDEYEDSVLKSTIVAENAETRQLAAGNLCNIGEKVIGNAVRVLAEQRA